MNVDVALLPSLLPPLTGSKTTVVVFDVLRATTTMAAAIAAKVAEIRIYATTDPARAVGGEGRLLCGEEQCLPPAGFDLGNSPGAFDPNIHRGKTVCMSTTNGTRAILAARGARRILTGAVVNAGAVARSLRRADATDVILICSGTNGQIAAEDVIGAGAVLHALRPHGPVRAQSDAADLAEDLFVCHRTDLPGALRNTRGGRNVIAADLEQDIEFAAMLDLIDVAVEVQHGNPPVAQLASSS